MMVYNVLTKALDINRSEEDICVYNVNNEIKTGNYGYLYSVL